MAGSDKAATEAVWPRTGVFVIRFCEPTVPTDERHLPIPPHVPFKRGCREAEFIDTGRGLTCGYIAVTVSWCRLHALPCKSVYSASRSCSDGVSLTVLDPGSVR
jgi:hypothetical protein